MEVSNQNQTLSDWRRIVSRYEKADWLHGTWQMVNTMVPLGLLVYLMYRSLDVSIWLTLLLGIPAAGLYVRAFSLFHDLAHASLFPSRRVNNIVGALLGVVMLTAFHQWQRRHALHHATVGNLDKRGHGYLWTMTVREYLEAPLIVRIAYRLFRHPLVLFGIAPLLKILIVERFVTEKDRASRLSVHFTNLALAVIVAVAWKTVGLQAFALVLGPILWLSGAAGLWLLYVQHTFEGTYWERDHEWKYEVATLYGSSFYQLPSILQWFVASINYHHIHHLAARVPNYMLQACHEENPLFQTVRPVSVQGSLALLRLVLWDEEQQRLVDWKALRLSSRVAS